MARPLSARRLAGDSALYATAGAVGKAIALFSVPILTRTLGAEGYGLTDLATSLAGALVLIGRFGGEVPVARAASHASSREDRKSVMGTFVLVTALVSTLLSIALVPAIPLITQFWSAPTEATLAGLSLILTPVSAVQIALVSVVRLDGRSVAVAGLAILDLGAQVAFALVLVLLGTGPVGALFGYVLGSLVGAAAAAIAARRSLSIRIDYVLGWRMFGEGIKYLPAFVAFTTADQVVRFITADSLGGEAVGSLAVAIRVASVVALAVSAFQFAWAPVALSMRPSHASGQTLGAALRWYLVIGVLATIALGAWAPVIVLVVAGQAFADAAPAVSGLAWSAALGGAIFMLMTVAGVAHRGGLVAAAAIAGAVLQLATALVGVEGAGLTAIAGAAVLGRVATFLLLGFGVRDFVSAWSWPILLCIAGGSAAMAVLTVVPNDAAFLALRLVIGTLASIAVVLLGIERLGGRGTGFRRLRRVGGTG